MIITSKDHAVIKEVSKLGSGAKYRREQGCFIAEGVRLCCDGVQSGAAVSALLYTGDARSRYPKEFEMLSRGAERVYEISSGLFQKVSDTKTPQGFLCVFRMPEMGEFSVRRGARYAALENIQDPSNLGTILRTAEALGVDGAILSQDCCDVYSPKVVRGSMGAVFRVPVMICSDFTGYILQLTGSGIKTYASTPHEAENIDNVDFSDGGVMLIGNEGSGLRAETIAACTKSVRITMKGRAESLNAAAAAAILMYRLQGQGEG